MVFALSDAAGDVAACTSRHAAFTHTLDRRLVNRVQPAVDCALGLVPGVAVALLQAAGEFLAPALNNVQVIVGELAPLLLGLAFELLPVSFDAIPIHLDLHIFVRWEWRENP